VKSLVSSGCPAVLFGNGCITPDLMQTNYSTENLLRFENRNRLPVKLLFFNDHPVHENFGFLLAVERLTAYSLGE